MGRHDRKYCKKWESESWAQGWLREHKSEDDVNQAYCIYCHSSLRAHAADLKKHINTPLHKRNTKNIKIAQNKKNTLNQYVTVISSTKDQKQVDLKLAAHVAIHSSFRSVDHLGELLKSIGHGCSTLENLRLHRTKCASLIENVIAPAMLTDIIKEIGDKRYSLILEESTDVSVNKYMAVCVRYFNERQYEILTDFLGLIEVERATAINLYESLKLFSEKIGLPLKNLLAIGTDGANNFCGERQSLFALLKTDVPDLILIKCTCHSIALCVSHASEELPNDLDFIAQEIYSWFSASSVRRIEYKRIFDLINLGEQKKFKNFVQLCKTRWLARYEVVVRILDNWLELKSFFSMLTEKCTKASILKSMLANEKNRLFFEFLKPILAEMNGLNIRFQGNNCDIGSAYYDMFLTIQSLATRLIKPIFLNLNYGVEQNILIKIKAAATNSLAYLEPDSCDLGYDFSKKVQALNLDHNEKQEILKYCFNFMKRLLIEMTNRLPSNIDTYEKVRMLNPYSCAISKSKDNFKDLPIIPFILKQEDQDKIEVQWRKLPEVSWKTCLKTEIPKNILEFWYKVYQFEDGASEFFFRELATVVLRMLSLPISNAVVERVFSIMNIVKTKIKNRMKLAMLESIIRIKIFLHNRNKCCNNFEITEQMLELFTSSIMYVDKNVDTEEQLALINELCDE